MEDLRAPRVTAFAEHAIREQGLNDNSYIRALRDGGMDLATFRRTQEQFYFAVTFFPRPMAALVGRISDPKSRLDILRNLVEEHGEFREEFFHHTTFRTFLSSIGSHPAGLDELSLWPAVRAFNSVLTCACVLDELEVGVGCIGVIERSFADISREIGRAVVDRGWVQADKLAHYKLHAEIDRRHADEFFAVAEPRWDDSRARYNIEQGVRMGAYIFDRLYADLLRAAV
jgi:pyrroloquinoline-quinone synthase